MLYASFVFYPRWKKASTEATLSWDVSGYYWYLPAIFIYKDVKKQAYKDEVIKKYQPTGNDFQQAFKHESGNYVMKYSAGMALMYLPFFTTAHLLAEPLGFQADGFSPPYQFAIQAGGLLVALLGLWYFRKFLLLFFSDTVTAICLLLLVFGSNFLNYGAIDSGMSHTWLFTIYLGILFATYHFYRAPGWKLAVSLGFLCGLATLTRPTDVISALIPCLWGLENLSMSALRKQFSFLAKHRKYILISFICAAIVFSIQLFYWKYSSGHWIVYSYQNQGFTWLHPHLKKYLIGAHNGWLSYSPVMIFSFLGLIPFLKNGKHRVAVIAFILLDLYIVASWEYYWYGGRFMIQAYPILFLPLASFIEWMLKSRVNKIIFVPILLLFVYVGLWTTVQYHYGNLYDWEMSNRKYYLATIGRWHVSEDVFKLKDTDELFQGDPQNVEQVYFNGFENDTTCNEEHAINGKHSICLSSPKDRYEFIFPYFSHKNEWLRAQATFHCKNREWNVWNMAQLIVSFENGNKEVKTKMIRVHRFLNDGDTKTLYIDTKVPSEAFNQVKISLWNADSKQILLIDDLKASVFDGKQ